MKTKSLIYLPLIMCLFLTFSLSVKAQSVSPQNNRDKRKLDMVKKLYEHQLLSHSLKDGDLNFTTIKGKPVFIQSQTAVAILAPDNMLAYIPVTKNPDNMPIFKHNYGKAGSVDSMPNVYRSNKTVPMITNRIKPDDNSSK